MWNGWTLERIFGGALALALEALVRSDGLTVRQVARVTGLSPSSASLALRRLAERGMARAVPVGTAVQYWLNESHFAIPHVRALVGEGDALLDRFPQLVHSALGSDPRCVILFGSTARSEAREDSDVDLLVVAHDQGELERWHARVDDLGTWLSDRVGGPLDVLMVTPPSSSDLRRPFWRNVLREGRVLVGRPLTGS